MTIGLPSRPTYGSFSIRQTRDLNSRSFHPLNMLLCPYQKWDDLINEIWFSGTEFKHSYICWLRTYLITLIPRCPPTPNPKPRLSGWLASKTRTQTFYFIISRLYRWSMDRRPWMALYQSLQSFQRNVPSHFHRESPRSLATGARGCSRNESSKDVPFKMSADMRRNDKLLGGTGTPALRGHHPKQRKSFSIRWR